MSKLKIAIIACGSMLVLATGANAYELRIGNGSTFVTVSPTPDGPSAATASGGRSQSPSGRPFGAANGAR